MKSEAAVRQKLKQVLFRHLKRDIEAGLAHLPHTCVHNGKAGGDLPRMCLLGADKPAKWPGNVCDEDEDGGELARACPFWKPVRTKEEIKSDFKTLVESNRGEVASRFPDAAALLWVLEEDTALDFNQEDGEEESLDENAVRKELPA